MKKIFIALLVVISLFSLAGCSKLGELFPGLFPTEDGNTLNDDNNDEKTQEQLPQEDNKIHLIILTGQSGARGKALNNSLSAELKEPNYDVDICADGLMMPALQNIPENLSSGAYLKEVAPGFGDTGTEFGPELGMGQTMASRYPKDGDARKSVIVKYTACGSTFKDHWYSTSAVDDDDMSAILNINQIREDKNGSLTGPLTNNLYQLIDSTIEQLNDEGYEVVIDGVAFVHGEQDAKYDDNMSIYEKALEYFIKDLRDYVGNPELPFVVTEALTNSAKYSNELRAIQKRVAEKVNNCSYISTTDLYTNTFEPWHFGTEGNFVLGNRIAAEIISLNDTRVVEEFEDIEVKVPYGVNVALPQYLNATFTNGYTGLVKVNYEGSYDANTLGSQTVKFTARMGKGTITSELKVNVSLEPYADGIINEKVYEDAFAHNIEGVGTLYVIKGEAGLYFAVKINDTEIWTEGEAWGTGDMGQHGSNDDFRIYLTTTSAAERITICLSSANLLRVYEAGTSLEDFKPAKNLYYGGFIGDYKYHVTTNGYANDNGAQTSGGMEMELYISYADLGVENPADIKMCFNYSNVNLVGGKKVVTNNYYHCPEAGVVDIPENNDSCYISLANLTNCNCEN